MVDEAGKHSRKISGRKRVDAKDVNVHFSEEAVGAFAGLSDAMGRDPTLRDGGTRLPATDYGDGCSDSVKDFLLSYSRMITSVRESSSDAAKSALDRVEAALRREGNLMLEVKQRKRTPGEE